MQRLETVLAGGIVPGALDQLPVHELNAEIPGADVHEPVKGINHRPVVLFALAQRLHGPFALGYVCSDAQYLGNLAALIQNGFVGPGNPDPFSIFENIFVYVLFKTVGIGQNLLHKRLHVPAGAFVFGNDRADNVLADQFFSGISKKLQAEFIQKDDFAVACPAKNNAVGMLHQFAVLLLTLFQGYVPAEPTVRGKSYGGTAGDPEDEEAQIHNVVGGIQTGQVAGEGNRNTHAAPDVAGLVSLAGVAFQAVLLGDKGRNEFQIGLAVLRDKLIDFTDLTPFELQQRLAFPVVGAIGGV